MSIKTLLFIFFLAILAVLLGIGRFYVLPTYYPNLLKSNAPQTAQVIPTPQPSLAPAEVTAQQRASISAQLLQKLTPRQKVAQLLAAPVTVVASGSASLDDYTEAAGVYTLFGSNISALAAEAQVKQLRTVTTRSMIARTLAVLTTEEEKLLQPLIAIDHEGGTVQRLKGEGITTVPSAEQQCALPGEELNSLTNRVAKELQSVGVNIVYGPVVDLAEKQPILGSRTCSADAEKVIRYGETWITALQDQRVMPVIKHYPGIGQTTVDLHKQATTITFNPREHSVFVALLKKFPQVGVMTSHVKLQVTESATATGSSSAELKPCTFSADCLALIRADAQSLRFTDALEMGAAQVSASSSTTTPAGLGQLSLQALQAGHTVLVYGPSVKPAEMNQVITDLADEYQRSNEVRKLVDQAVLTVWQAKFEYLESLQK